MPQHGLWVARESNPRRSRCWFVLGHWQAQTTARYAHLDADPLLRAANLIGERIENAMNPPVVTTSAEA